MAPTGQWNIPDSADDELENAREYKSGLFPNERRIQLLDSLEQLRKRLGVRRTVSTDSRLTAKESCCGAGKVEFERLVFLILRICRLVPHLHRQPHLSRSVTLYHLANVRTAVGDDSGESLIQIRFTYQKWKIAELSEVSHMGIEPSARTPVKSGGIAKEFLPLRNCLSEKSFLAGNELFELNEPLGG